MINKQAISINLNYEAKFSSCPICGENNFQRIADYSQCRSCGHQLLSHSGAIFHIVNEALDIKNYSKQTALERFQVKAALNAATNSDYVVDFGSGSGRFLFSAKKSFKQHAGVEVSPTCIEFCQEDLGLNVTPQIPEDIENVSVVTLWHSLEHLDLSIFKNLTDSLKKDSRILISVPSGSSLQFHLFRSRWAYYDVPHHLHQFSSESLDRLLNQLGWVPVADYPSLAYAGFGYLQSLMNVLNGTHNYFYYRKKRAMTFGFSAVKLAMLDLYNAFLIPVLFPVASALALFDLLIISRAGVVTRSFRKK